MLRKLGRFWGVWLASARPSGQTEVKSGQVADTTLHQWVEQHHNILVCSSCPELRTDCNNLFKGKFVYVWDDFKAEIVAKSRNRCPEAKKGPQQFFHLRNVPGISHTCWLFSDNSLHFVWRQSLKKRQLIKIQVTFLPSLATAVALLESWETISGEAVLSCVVRCSPILLPCAGS